MVRFLDAVNDLQDPNDGISSKQSSLNLCLIVQSGCSSSYYPRVITCRNGRSIQARYGVAMGE